MLLAVSAFTHVFFCGFRKGPQMPVRCHCSAAVGLLPRQPRSSYAVSGISIATNAPGATLKLAAMGYMCNGQFRTASPVLFGRPIKDRRSSWKLPGSSGQTGSRSMLSEEL